MRRDFLKKSRRIRFLLFLYVLFAKSFNFVSIQRYFLVKSRAFVRARNPVHHIVDHTSCSALSHTVIMPVGLNFIQHNQRFNVFCLGEHIVRGYAFNPVYAVAAAFYKFAVPFFKRARQKTQIPRKRGGTARN